MLLIIALPSRSLNYSLTHTQYGTNTLGVCTATGKDCSLHEFVAGVGKGSIWPSGPAHIQSRSIGTVSSRRAGLVDGVVYAVLGHGRGVPIFRPNAVDRIWGTAHVLWQRAHGTAGSSTYQSRGIIVQ